MKDKSSARVAVTVAMRPELERRLGEVAHRRQQSRSETIRQFLLDRLDQIEAPTPQPQPQPAPAPQTQRAA
jgi:hypothetical protein